MFDKLPEVNTNNILVYEKELSPLKNFTLSSMLDKITLHMIAKLLPAHSIVVEMGTYLGASAAIMAHANPQLEIHSYDLFDFDKIYAINQEQLVSQALGFEQLRTLENVGRFLERYSNIHLHKVNPGDLIDFDKEIDLFIEDSSHRNPQLTNSLNNWLPKVKINGLALLHDYNHWLDSDNENRHQSVEDQVTLLSQDKNWKFLGQVTNLENRDNPYSSYAIFKKLNNVTIDRF
jgi:hypothetical protein